MSTWEIVRQQVTLSGIVSGNDGRPLRGAQVTATAAGKKQPPSLTSTRDDGSYFFTDLPDGAYSVTATAAGKSVQGEAHVKSDATGTSANQRLNLMLKT